MLSLNILMPVWNHLIMIPADKEIYHQILPPWDLYRMPQISLFLDRQGQERHIFPVHWVLKPAGRHIGCYISECLILCVILKTIGMISGH